MQSGITPSPSVASPQTPFTAQSRPLSAVTFASPIIGERDTEDRQHQLRGRLSQPNFLSGGDSRDSSPITTKLRTASRGSNRDEDVPGTRVSPPQVVVSEDGGEEEGNTSVMDVDN